MIILVVLFSALTLLVEQQKAFDLKKKFLERLLFDTSYNDH